MRAPVKATNRGPGTQNVTAEGNLATDYTILCDPASQGWNFTVAAVGPLGHHLSIRSLPILLVTTVQRRR
jgi:hypothetical protein